MEKFISDLKEVFNKNANIEFAAGMKAYMRDQFEFFGIKAPLQKSLRKEFLKTHHINHVEDLRILIPLIWEQPEREFQHFGLYLFEKHIKKITPEFLDLIEYMVVTKSWWDTVDFIAPHLVGTLMKQYPNSIESTIRKWLDSGNMWLQRSAILFQLKYKSETDTELLFRIIEELSGSTEFFIRKAIGWSLREYSKTNPEIILKFVETHQLSGLSHREALKVIERKKQKPH